MTVSARRGYFGQNNFSAYLKYSDKEDRGEKGVKKLYFVHLIALLIFVISASATPRAAWAANQDEFWKGFESAQKDLFIKVVENQEEWSGLWKRAFEKPAPEVDFNQHVVACVFLGHQADWLYSIHIDDPVRRGDVWVVTYELVQMILELSGPFKARGQYAMKVLERTKDGPMILEETGRSGRRK